MATQAATPDYRNLYNVDQTVSTNITVPFQVGDEVLSIQVTSRFGATAEQITETARRNIAAVTALRAEFPAPSRGHAPAPSAPVPTGENKKYEPKPVERAPEGLPEGEYFKDEFDYFIVEPQPDGKTTVKFYKDSLKFPVGASINKWKHASVSAILGKLIEGFDPTVAEKYRVAGVQFWTKGNEYTKQNGEKSNYKDFRDAQLVW